MKLQRRNNSSNKPPSSVRICKAQGCFTLFTIGKGGKQPSTLYCSNACKTRAHRSGGAVTQEQKIDELNEAFFFQSERLLEAQRLVETIKANMDGIVSSLDVATRETWDEAIDAIRREQQKLEEHYEAIEILSI